jgi:hypothetical protein
MAGRQRKPSVSVAQATHEGQLALLEALLLVIAERMDEDISARDLNLLTLQAMRFLREIKALQAPVENIWGGNVEPA